MNIRIFNPLKVSLALICSLAVLASCSGRKAANKKSDSDATTTMAMEDKQDAQTSDGAATGKVKAPLPCDLKVSFYSIGSGINYKAKEAFDVFLKNWHQQRGIGVEHDIQPWGREGELDYCISTQGMDDKTKKDFETVLREQIRDQKWVKLVEN